jgi:hypothetical protein
MSRMSVCLEGLKQVPLAGVVVLGALIGIVACGSGPKEQPDANTCPPPLRTCSAGCTSTAIDPDHCGDCNTACPARPNALPVCAASQCDFVCASGWRDCDGLATTGCEAAVLTDSANCGTCGNACAGGGACFDGHCPFGLDFDGVDDTLASKTALAHGLSSTFTAEFWIRADGTTWMKLLNIHNGPNLDVDMEIRPDELAYCTLFDQSGNNHGSTSTSQVVLGAWTHIACSYDGTTQRMFVNGVLEASTAWTGQVELDAPVTISGFESRYIDGVVDEFRLSTSARYTASFTPPAHFAADANALVLWLLDGGTGITVVDSSGHGFDGQLGDGAAAPTWSPVVR